MTGLREGECIFENSKNIYVVSSKPASDQSEIFNNEGWSTSRTAFSTYDDAERFVLSKKSSRLEKVLDYEDYCVWFDKTRAYRVMRLYLKPPSMVNF